MRVGAVTAARPGTPTQCARHAAARSADRRRRDCFSTMALARTVPKAQRSLTDPRPGLGRWQRLSKSLPVAYKDAPEGRAPPLAGIPSALLWRSLVNSSCIEGTLYATCANDAPVGVRAVRRLCSAAAHVARRRWL
jgi:hypothetical protein